jgi:hypothetical protein
VEVTDEFGTCGQPIDTAILDRLGAEDRAFLDALAAGLVRHLASLLGGNEDWARHVALSELARRVFDQDAYDRVRARRRPAKASPAPGMAPLF